MLRSFTLSAFRIPSSTSSSCFPSTSSSSHLPLGVDLRRLLRIRCVPSPTIRTLQTHFHSTAACLSSSESNSMSVDELLEQINLKKRKIEELKRETKKLKRRNKEIFDQQEKEKNQLLKEGLPPLGPPLFKRQRSFIHGGPDNIHRLMNSSLGIFSQHLVDDLVTPTKAVIWNMANIDDGHLWANEGQIRRYIYLALEDIVTNGHISLQVQFWRELSVFGRQTDESNILVLRNSSGIPIGLCHMETPTDDALNDSDRRLFEQVFDYMIGLRNLYGLRHVFSIVTSYEKWRICWLPDTDAIARSTQLEDNCNDHPIDPKAADKREMNVSKMYSYNDPHLIRTLISLMHKMNRSEVLLPTELIHSDRSYISLHRTGWLWKQLPSEITKLSYMMPKRNGTDNFVLLQEYHGGADGRVWLAMSNEGELLVIKLMIWEGSASHLARKVKNEITVWNKVWKVNTVRKAQLGGWSAILMPFVFHCHLNKDGITLNGPNRGNPLRHEVKEDQIPIEKLLAYPYSYDEMKSFAKEAIESMLDGGYEHNDMAWRHIALMPILSTNDSNFELAPKWTLKPILIDLSHVIQLPNNMTQQEKAEKCDKLLQKLQIEYEKVHTNQSS